MTAAIDFRRTRRVSTTTPTIEVAPGLRPGRYLVRLTATDEAGNTSQPAQIMIEIVHPRFNLRRLLQRIRGRVGR